MQYFSICILNMHQIQQKNIFGWVRRNFLAPPVQKIFVCVILAFAPLLPHLSTPLYYIES